MKEYGEIGPPIAGVVKPAYSAYTNATRLTTPTITSTGTFPTLAVTIPAALWKALFALP
ncbi:MAG TPA: hypothetical protein VED17_04105 [Nitrososphaerales archaeon]|nr:hypothetical protein [Nitrososphaerales archaeon]